jgi:pectate lyase
VIDHVSASWSEDETVSTWYGAHDVTISWSIISEALNRSRHRKRTHSAGLLIGDSSYNVSVHHNLLAHNDFRNPLISEGGTHDIVNNVIYNWGVLPAEIVDLGANTFVNFVGNIFVIGPSTPPDSDILVIVGEPRIYAEGNFVLQRPKVSFREWALFGPGVRPEATPSDEYGSDTRFMTPPVTALDAAQLFRVVLDQAGATAPQRDSADDRVVSEVLRRQGAIIDSPSDVGGYPVLAAGQPFTDSDHDGMPDVWEWSLGLDLGDPADGSGDPDGDGYTNLEEYLHWIAEEGARE